MLSQEAAAAALPAPGIDAYLADCRVDCLVLFDMLCNAQAFADWIRTYVYDAHSLPLYDAFKACLHKLTDARRAFERLLEGGALIAVPACLAHDLVPVYRDLIVTGTQICALLGFRAGPHSVLSWHMRERMRMIILATPFKAAPRPVQQSVLDRLGSLGDSLALVAFMAVAVAEPARALPCDFLEHRPGVLTLF